MKIGELRAAIKKHSKADLEFLVAELYKLVPKTKKEDYQIDKLIVKPTKNKKSAKKKAKLRTIEEIAEDVEFFHDNAVSQHYLIPNTNIPKKERPKWRFVVKRLYKEILQAEKSGNSTVRCARELQVLYETLTYACDYIIFSAYDPFESVGIEQTVFFEQIIKLYRESLDISDFIHKGIKLTIENSLNRYTLYSELMEIFISYCQTPAMKEMAIDKLLKMREEFKKKPIVTKNSWSNEEYRKNEKLNYYTEFIFRLYAHLFEFEKGIKDFNLNSIQNTKEVSLYILIRMLFGFEKKQLIVREIEKNMKIKPRESLLKLKDYIKKNNKLPEYM